MGTISRTGTGSVVALWNSLVFVSYSRVGMRREALRCNRQCVSHLLSTLEDNNMPKYRELGNDESVDLTDVIIEESGERVYKCSSCHFFHFL